MDNQDDAAKPSRPRRAARASKSRSGEPAWETVMEVQRTRLMQVQGLLHCLHEVLLYAEDEHATTYADIAQLAGGLVGDCVSALDTVQLRRLIKQDPTMDTRGFHGGLQVREPPVKYLL